MAKIDKISVGGVTYDINLPTNATPTISALTTDDIEVGYRAMLTDVRCDTISGTETTLTIQTSTVSDSSILLTSPVVELNASRGIGLSAPVIVLDTGSTGSVRAWGAMTLQGTLTVAGRVNAVDLTCGTISGGANALTISNNYNSTASIVLSSPNITLSGSTTITDDLTVSGSTTLSSVICRIGSTDMLSVTSGGLTIPSGKFGVTSANLTIPTTQGKLVTDTALRQVNNHSLADRSAGNSIYTDRLVIQRETGISGGQQISLQNLLGGDMGILASYSEGEDTHITNGIYKYTILIQRVDGSVRGTSSSTLSFTYRSCTSSGLMGTQKTLVISGITNFSSVKLSFVVDTSYSKPTGTGAVMCCP